MRRDWITHVVFAAVSCVLLAISTGAGGTTPPETEPARIGPDQTEVLETEPAEEAAEPGAEEIRLEMPPVEIETPGEVGFENASLRGVRVQAQGVVYGEPGERRYFSEALFPEFLGDSPDIRELNRLIGFRHRNFEESSPDRWADDPEKTFTYAARQEGPLLTVTLLGYFNGAWQMLDDAYTVDTETGIAPAYQAIRDQFAPVDRSGGLVETRYEGFQDEAAGPTATLHLPRVLLASPDAEAVNQEIADRRRTEGGMYGFEDGDIHVWYEAYQYGGLLSVGIKERNIFDCTHVTGGWTFDLNTGELLDNREVLARLGAAPEDFSEQLRGQVLDILDGALETALEMCGEYDWLDEAAVRETYERECRDAREWAYAPEEFAFYVTDTGEVHLSLWDSSHRVWGDCDCEDWTYERTLTFPQSAG